MQTGIRGARKHLYSKRLRANEKVFLNLWITSTCRNHNKISPNSSRSRSFFEPIRQANCPSVIGFPGADKKKRQKPGCPLLCSSSGEHRHGGEYEAGPIRGSVRQ